MLLTFQILVLKMDEILINCSGKAIKSKRMH